MSDKQIYPIGGSVSQEPQDSLGKPPRMGTQSDPEDNLDTKRNLLKPNNIIQATDPTAVGNSFDIKPG